MTLIRALPTVVMRLSFAALVAGGYILGYLEGLL